MKTKISVDNLKCGGCAGSIKKSLSSFSEVNEVAVDIESGDIDITHDDGFDIKIVKNKLHAMGYPEKGTSEGLDKLLTGAKSYVSCAIGKLTTNEEESKK